MSDFMVPDMIEPIVAWRVWQVNPDGLASVNQGAHWPTRERMEARCSRSEPSTYNQIGWEAVSSKGETMWLRDALESEVLQMPFPGYNVAYGLGPTGVTYHPVATSYSSASTVISTVPDPVELPTVPSDLILPRGWEYRIGHREVVYPPMHAAAPAEQCSCGLYALKARDMGSSYLSSAQAWGEVYLWGKVIEGDFGYRAQYAYPKNISIAVLGNGYDHLEQYGVPIQREGAMQVAITRALPTGPRRRMLRVGIFINLAAIVITALLFSLGALSIWNVAALSVNVASIVLLLSLSAWMSRP